MPSHRTAIVAAVVLTALPASGCQSAIEQTPPPATIGSARPDGPSVSATSTPAATPKSSPRPAPAGMVGTGCAGYQDRVPAGPGALDGMGRDPVTVALANSPMLTTFAGALAGRLNSEVDLAETLNRDQYTVFAPTDEAFGRVDPATIGKFRSDSQALTSVLDYHVFAGQTDADAVAGEHTTLQGGSLTVTGSGDNLQVNGADVLCGPLRTANATVYLIDTVLMPPAPAPTTSITPTTTSTP